MDADFEKNILQAFSLSQGDCIMQHKQDNKEIELLERQLSLLGSRIIEGLGDKKRLFLRYEEMTNRLISYQQDIVYQKGQKDNVALLKMLGLL